MNEFEELEKLVEENEPEPAPSNSEMDVAYYAYHLAVIIIDGGTAYMIGALTIWYYGVLWFLANAIVFFIHHKNWERDANNHKQTKMSMIGMIVSVATMFIAAAGAGSLYMLQLSARWVSITIEIFAVVAFFYHSISFAMYRFTDDKWMMDRQVAKAKSNARKKIKIAQAAGSVIKANQEALRERNKQYKDYGRGVVDKALEKVGGQPFTPRAAPMSADTDANPTDGQKVK